MDYSFCFLLPQVWTLLLDLPLAREYVVLDNADRTVSELGLVACLFGA